MSPPKFSQLDGARVILDQCGLYKPDIGTGESVDLVTVRRRLDEYALEPVLRKARGMLGNFWEVKFYVHWLSCLTTL
ncbi:hypothetical protein SKTS_28790 [Sulfurimicrobium lacus]|uniref:Uncharacterized protein n=1 Tax=Sulfurimicrobium lacus TaxID=2715678 RepID=A0A6F8VDU6_9PROT|nr:hypothetical protein SKTS_28790 [Sulfurimicrobium lacus]